MMVLENLKKRIFSMSEKKKNFIIGLLAVLVIALAASIVYLSIKVRNNDNAVSSNGPIIKELVSTAYYKVIMDEDNSEYTYDVPKINLEFENIKAINNEIYKKYVTDIIKPLEKDAQEGLGITCIAIDYKYYINSNVLSLVIRWQSPAAGAESFTVYNINIDTGETVSNQEIIAKKGLSEKQYLKHLKEVYKKACETYNKTSLQPDSEYYESTLEIYNTWVLEYTLSDENCNINVPMFLDENGNIKVIAYIGSVSGASGYEHILNTRNVKQY